MKRELFDGQTYNDRHDLLARVFRQKLIRLMEVIKKCKIFGAVRCDMYTIEWQKRGLPHAHILIWLTEKIHAHHIDDLICAELPNPDEDPVLFEIIKGQMVHGLCGVLNPNAPCMQDGKCTKKYPRPFIDETQTGEDGYPSYRRRRPGQGGFSGKIKIRGHDYVIDNRWIVPHCKLLSKAFNAHINVEICNSVKSIKYVCKYVNKGSDAAMYAIQNPDTDDEVTHYQMGRYISSNEACWRLLGFPIHERHPAIINLSVHLENGQRVYFTKQNALQQAVSPKDTTLTAFFKLCQQDPFAVTLFYHEVPSYFTWNNKEWNRRKRGAMVTGCPGIYKDEALGRVYTVHPGQQECFYLRILLHAVKGPTSFDALRTVNGQVCGTYREACFRRGLLESDAQWDATLTEATVSQSAGSLRNLFAIILASCEVGNPRELWDKYKEDLAEDFLHQIQVQNPSVEVQFNEATYNKALIVIEDKVLSLSGRKLTTFGLPSSSRTESDDMPREELQERSYNIDQLTLQLDTNLPRLLPDQRLAFNTIMTSVHQKSGGIYFLDAPGGTGKTFVTTLLLDMVRQQQGIAIAVASSGIAATLLPGGRTAHSAFKLPLNLTSNDSATCNISKGSGLGKLLKICSMIVWDECTMSHKAAFEALDSTLQDIRNCRAIMGGVTLVLSGDFRQTLPVIPRGTRPDELKACLKSSHLWRSVKKLRLTTNMRAKLHGDQLSGQFATDLLALGDGKVPVGNDGDIPMSPLGIMVESVEELRGRVFPSIVQNYRNHKWLCERAILAPKNETVNETNLKLLDLVPGQLCTYLSVDTVPDQSQVVHYPVEFLNSLEPPGVPPHRLSLKVGVPIMLLRNMDPPRLCNGTRLAVKRLMPHVIEATILTGCGQGEDVFIPRIPIIHTDMPFDFRRLQFPITLSFAMTINKSQGQTLKIAGLQLQEPCFSHGQLYVGCSRVGSKNDLYIYAPFKKTKNIVYQEALR